VVVAKTPVGDRTVDFVGQIVPSIHDLEAQWRGCCCSTAKDNLDTRGMHAVCVKDRQQKRRRKDAAAAAAAVVGGVALVVGAGSYMELWAPHDAK
jgi:hypothetical protein